MYVPAHFREENLSILHNFIKEHNFGILVTQYEGVPFATHLPFVFYPERGPHGTLVAHMARANPHWRSFTSDSEALVIFSGPTPTFLPPGTKSNSAFPPGITLPYMSTAILG